ncbi:NAD-dependent protein deacylase [Durusdinium trenchii]|uniref:NAD-dependent protein deacylase n=1 Tax=Durusdinium trenchii TaxID=1381693 RepID=A0ABP0JIG0_9DINO
MGRELALEVHLANQGELHLQADTLRGMSIDPSDGMSIDPLLQQRQEGLKEAEPNAAHRALVELETREARDRPYPWQAPLVYPPNLFGMDVGVDGEVGHRDLGLVADETLDHVAQAHYTSDVEEAVGAFGAVAFKAALHTVLHAAVSWSCKQEAPVVSVAQDRQARQRIGCAMTLSYVRFVIEIHGTMATEAQLERRKSGERSDQGGQWVASREGKPDSTLRSDITTDRWVPRHPETNGVLKPDITMFGEALPAGALAASWGVVLGSPVCLVVGTGLNVAELAPG